MSRYFSRFTCLVVSLSFILSACSVTDTHAMEPQPSWRHQKRIEKENIKVVSRLINQALNKGNSDIVDELVAENAVDYDAFPNQPAGREGFRYHFEVLKTAMPDLNVQFKIYADGNTVFEEWVGKGTNTGPFPFMDATGREVEFPGITIFELEGGKIVSRRTYQDSILLDRQLGLVPEG